ncbi:MAG: hypothetical protein JXR15_03225 [Shimia sp.]|uniref:hypothetical protein n=1 Tax=Shimia sp. TaxID=1954381 RepID=UPI003B8B8D8C
MDGVSALPNPIELVETSAVRLAALPGRSDTAVILLRSFNPKVHTNPKVSYPLAEYVWADGQRHVLVVQDLLWGWLSAPGAKSLLLEGIKAYFESNNISRVFAVGNSAGGSILMDLCGDVKIDALLAISPQIDLGPAYRAFDRRQSDWSDWLDDTAQLPNPWRAFESDTHLTVLHGLRGADAAHAAICPTTPRLQHLLFPDMEHDLRQRIGGAKPSMRQMVDHLCNMNFDAMQRIALENGAFLRGQAPSMSPKASGWGRHPKAGVRASALQEGHTVAET